MEIFFNSPVLMWIFIINIISVIVCAADKIKAKKHSRRISEKTLFLLSFLGGALFMYVTMRLIRHKTLHKKFMIGLPVLIIFHCIIAILVVEYAPYLIFGMKKMPHLFSNAAFFLILKQNFSKKVKSTSFTGNLSILAE